MNLSQETFTEKLYSLCQEYMKLQERIDFCRSSDIDKIKASAADIKKECDENRKRLTNNVEHGKNPAVKTLSKAQLDFEKRFSEISDEISGRALFDEKSKENDDLEASMLFAEYAIDFATLSMKQAALAAVNAVCKEYAR